MKKTILIAAFAYLLGSVPVFAVKSTVNTEIAQEKNKKKVKEADLPDAVKRVLSNSVYKDWEKEQIYLVEEADYYQIELKKDDQKQTLNLDKYGNKVSVIE